MTLTLAMRSIVAVLLALVAVANASSSSSVDSFVSEYYASSYTYVVMDVDGQDVTRKQSSCPPPPSSIEVCLSSLFSTLENQIHTIQTSLHVYQSSLNQNMHHEHTLLTSLISWVSAVNNIAKSVNNVVHEDYLDVSVQVYQLQKELIQIKQIYYYEYAHLESLYEDQQQVIKEQREIYEQHQYVINAKWSLQGYISAIVQQKIVIESAIAEIEFVVSRLDEQIYEIYAKVEQLNKRQLWLGNWQEKLYVDLEAFQKEINVFRAVQTDLIQRETDLYKNQDRLKQFALAAEVAVDKMHLELVSIYSYIKALDIYEDEITSIYFEVYVYAAQFITDYEDFTCEDSLLYYEACSSSPVAPAPPKAPAPAQAKAAAPIAANAPAVKAVPANAAPAKAAPAKANNNNNKKVAAKKVDNKKPAAKNGKRSVVV